MTCCETWKFLLWSKTRGNYWTLVTCRASDTYGQAKHVLVNIHHYYTTQAVRGPITKINQSKCSIASPIFSKYRTRHCPEWSRTCVFASLCFLQSCNKSLINQACSGPYWENIGPPSFLYGPLCAQSVLSRPWANILLVRPSHLVNKIYMFTLPLVNYNIIRIYNKVMISYSPCYRAINQNIIRICSN